MPLRLEVTASLSDKVFLGNLAAQLETGDVPSNISRVILNVDSGNYYTSGDDTGRTLEVACPWGSQAMADSILAAVKNYSYQPYTAEDALLDPAAELGDAVTVGGIYSVIASADMQFDRACAPTISAPESDEIDDEYPYETRERKETNRQLAQTRSLITKTSEQIRLEVENELKGLSTEFAVELKNIPGRVNGLDGEFSELSLTIDGLTVTDSTGTTKIKGSSVETDTLIVNAANINGTLTANQINLSGAITWGDLAQDTQNEIDGAYNAASSAQSTASNAYSLASSAQATANSANSTVSAWKYLGTTYIDGTQLMTGTVTASTLRGGTIGILNDYGSQVGYITVGSSTTTGLQLISGGNLYLASGSCSVQMVGRNMSVSCNNFCPSGTAANLGNSSLGMWQAVYSYTAEIQTSDENIKHDIAEIPQKYIDMMDDIVPVIYKMDNGTSDRYHTGFIAQNVKEAMDAHGVSDLELAAWCKDVDTEGNELQMLRYMEFIAIMWAKIKQLEAKINGTSQEGSN